VAVFAQRKSSYHTLEGHFVDQCPTADVIAVCDQQQSAQTMHYFYRGAHEGPLNYLHQTVCSSTGTAIMPAAGTFTRKVPAVRVPKPPADGGPFATACLTEGVTGCDPPAWARGGGRGGGEHRG
jgi:hypothetical protein